MAAALVAPRVTTSQVAAAVAVATRQFLMALPISSKQAEVAAAADPLKQAVVVLVVEVEAQPEPHLPKTV